MSRPFAITREVDLPASPDDVWTAITADTAAWQFPTGVEVPAGSAPPPGSPMQTWEPPRRLVIRTEAPDGTVNALDYTIEAGGEGTAGLHYVHSGVLPDGWEDQYDAIGAHTDFYLHTLGEYLRTFNGRHVTYVGQPSAGIEGPSSASGPEAMEILRVALGLSPGARVGDPVSADLGAAGALVGVIDYATPAFLGVRTADSLYRFFGRNHFGGVVGLSAHVFRDDVDAVAAEAALTSWLDSVYA